MAVRASGYRLKAIAGHHRTTFDAAEVALGSSASTYIIYFDRCRRMRNDVDYDHAFVASETDAVDLHDQAGQFLQLVEAWIGANHPELAK